MKYRLTPDEIGLEIRKAIPEGTVVAEHTKDEHWYRYKPLDIKLPSVTTMTSILQAPHLKRWTATVAIDYLEEHAHEITPAGIPVDLRKAAILAHEDIFEDAGGIGTQGHGIIENYLKDWIGTGKQPSDITKYIIGEDYRLWAITRSAQKFFNTYMALPVASELKVVYLPPKHPEKGYAGTLDALMFLAFNVREGDPKCKHDVALKAGQWDELGCMNCDAKWKYELTLVDFKTSNSIDNKDEYLMQTAAYWKALHQMTGIKTKRIVIVRLDKSQEKYQLLEVLKPSVAFTAFKHIEQVNEFIRKSEDQKAFAIEGKEVISVNDL